MSNHTDGIDRHYGSIDISARIVAAVRAAGLDPSRVSRDDLASFDEFHTGGRGSTRELARLAGLREGQEVLDVGSGIGGPARTLAAEFGCRVTGIDVTEAFCAAATMLTGWVGLDDRVTFRQGDARHLPFPDGSFDVVWAQNSMMNIEDKAGLFREIHRVLRPDGTLAFDIVLAGPTPGMHFPTFWASSAGLNFLVRPAELRQLLEEAGFVVRDWIDQTAARLESARRRQEKAAEPGPVLGREVIVTEDVPLKIENSVRNTEEGHTLALRVIAARPA